MPMPAGFALVTSGDGVAWQTAGDVVGKALLREALDVRERRRVTLRDAARLPARASRHFSPCCVRPPRILVLGGGLDAGPVVRFAAELGWRVALQDHRPAYLQKADFTLAEQVLCLPTTELAEQLELSQFQAAIVMSHHLGSDRDYLRQLAATPISYIGLLGPRHRRERLVGELGEAGKALAGRLYGPAGLDIGGSGPASIALSIVAQMHAVIVAETRTDDGS